MITNKKFLILPFPKEDEFILSYLLRLKKYNGYPSVISLIKIIFGENTKKINIVKGDFNKNIFSNFTELTYLEIDKLCLNKKNNEYYSVEYLIVCPLCLLERDYIPIGWYKRNTMCSIHSIPYISRCPHCDKLLKWETKKLEICFFCKTPIYLNIDKYIINHKDINNKNNLFIIYDYLYSHNLMDYRSSNKVMHSIKYLYNALMGCVNFLLNPEYIIRNEIRKIFIQINLKHHSNSVIEYDYFLYIFKIIKLIRNLSEDGLIIKRTLSKYVNINIIERIMNNYEIELFYFLTGDKRRINFDKEISLDLNNFSKIINIDYSSIFLFVSTNLVELNESNEIYLNDFIFFCQKLSKKISKKDINKDFTYYIDLPDNIKLIIFDTLLTTPLRLYNFNYEDVFWKIKIDNFELEEIIGFSISSY